jgi:hypothetical protein
VTIIKDEDDGELVRIYRQHDGYPTGHGIELAKLCDVKITNGITGDGKGTANGMGCLAAQVIMGLKQAVVSSYRPSSVGGIYIEKASGPLNDWVEYVYEVKGGKDQVPIIACTTKTGEWPFNMQQSEGHEFTGTAKEWLAKYATPGATD